MKLSWAFLLNSVPFSTDVILGHTSLGGSESACLGLGRALAKMGQTVSFYVGQLQPDCHGKTDPSGAFWYPLEDFSQQNESTEFDVCVSQRMYQVFQDPPRARLRLLWNEDLLVPGAMQLGVMSVSYGFDKAVYVSEYHRQQWEQLQPELKHLGWVSRNGFDPADLPAHKVEKNQNRVIHISRPERGLGPLLAMWPKLKAIRPNAELQICRYSSMYDQGPGSWSDVCASWDQAVQQVNATVGGVTYLGELNKKDLYQAVSEAAVMWYPGVETFAETSCIAAIESQACGTPFVGSYRGALPETIPAGILIKGNATNDPAYHEASVKAVADLLDGCKNYGFKYRQAQQAGLKHAERYNHDEIAHDWMDQVSDWFQERHDKNRRGILRQLLHEDDHVAAKMLAEQMGDAKTADFCQYVMDGKDQSAEHYGNAAIQDPLEEVKFSSRFRSVHPVYKDCTHVLDVACGNGAFAIGLALAHPAIRVTGIDYSQANIERARDAAQRAGVAERVEFHRMTVYDFDRHRMHEEWNSAALFVSKPFDGAFCGEFVEHVVNYAALIEGVETVLAYGSPVVYTCPHGAYAEMVPRGMALRRGHVHRFHYDDVQAVWGPKKDFRADYFASGITERGGPVGNWIIGYHTAPDRPCGKRPLSERILKTRPMPTLTVGIIAKDAENDIGRCLSSVYKIADQILVGDTGSADATKEIAESYGATILDLPPVDQNPEGFAGTRNEVLNAATGEWFLWIDCDEALIQYPFLRRYLDGSTFNGYVIPQTHLYLDGPPTQDIPVRLFRNTGKVRFYGCIHEQPQDGDPNADIFPSLHVADLQMAHTGYLTQQGRESKRVERNLPLLIKDTKTFPDRMLGRVLCLREAVIQADSERRTQPEHAQKGYAYAIRLFLQHFDDPSHKYHTLARPWYEAALQHLGLGWEQEVALAGRKGGLQGTHAKPERVWVRDADEFTRLMEFKIKGLAKKMVPVSFITDPDDLKPKVEEVEGVAV